VNVYIRYPPDTTYVGDPVTVAASLLSGNRIITIPDPPCPPGELLSLADPPPPAPLFDTPLACPAVPPNDAATFGAVYPPDPPPA